MTFYKTAHTNNTRVPITKEEARSMIADCYGERNADRHMSTLLKDKIFGLWYWTLLYEPTPETYCTDQGCTFPGETCGYYPSQCIAEKYGTR